MPSVTIDGAVPADSENESLGAGRIRNLAAAINGLFGQGVTFTYGVNPFTVDGLGNITVNATITVPTPTAAGQAATKAYVDASSSAIQSVYSSVSNGGVGNAYVGSASPLVAALATNVLYILQFQQSNPGGPVTVNLTGSGGPLGAVTVKKAGNVDLAASDIPAGGILACFYDGTNFQIAPAGGANAAAFQGIGVSPTAPTNNQVWQYNSGTGLWTPTTLGTSVAGGYGSQTITTGQSANTGAYTSLTGTLALTAPASGGPFRLLASYFVGVQNGTGSDANVQMRVTDGTNQWAYQGAFVASGKNGGMGMSEMSPATYANGATPSLNVQAVSNHAVTLGTADPVGGATSYIKGLFIPSN